MKQKKSVKRPYLKIYFLAFVMIILISLAVFLQFQVSSGKAVYSKSNYAATTITSARTDTTQTYHVPSVKDYGAKGDGVADDTHAFYLALADSLEIYIPPGTYRVANLNPRAGTVITASRDAIIKGPSAEAAIFKTTGSLCGIRIKGGSWGNAKYVWLHTGNSALCSSYFEEMSIGNAEFGFSLSSSVGNYWKEDSFGSNGYGIEFTGDGAGQTNLNFIEDSKFFNWKKGAIRFGDGTSPKFQNVIKDSWFENDAGGLEPSIYIGGNVKSLMIENNYFEEAGCCSANNPGIVSPDIMLNAPFGSSKQVREVMINKNVFAAPFPAQTERIRNAGLADFSANDNYVSLNSGQVFAALGGLSSRLIYLYQNYLNANAKESDYQTRLFKSIAGQKASWSTFVDSGNVDDSSAKEVINGQIINSIVTLEDTSAPSVRSGNVFVTSASSKTTVITDFKSGSVGQTIKVMAQHSFTISPGSIKLNGSAPFSMKPGDSLTLTMYAYGMWTEDSRSVN